MFPTLIKCSYRKYSAKFWITCTLWVNGYLQSCSLLIIRLYRMRSMQHLHYWLYQRLVQILMSNVESFVSINICYLLIELCVREPCPALATRTLAAQTYPIDYFLACTGSSHWRLKVLLVCVEGITTLFRSALKIGLHSY